MASVAGLIYQAAAIPIHHGRICLVRSSSGKRWVIPKGCLEPGKTVEEIALQEAWEEAGLGGVLESDPAGIYFYEKYGGTCHVTVFFMQVTNIAAEYPEAYLRERIWVKPGEVVQRLGDEGLRELLRRVLQEERQVVRA